MQKINYIKIKDFKWIKNIETNNLSRFVVIFWQNWAWKTSFIEAIKNSIKAEQWINQKVRIGEDKWEIIVEFDDFKIKRIVWKNWWLEVEHNWELVSRPQEWLNNIFQWVIWDPQKFLNLHNKEKVKYLLETQWKIDEYNVLEADRLLLYNNRTDTHRTYLSKKEEIDKMDISEFENVIQIDNSDIDKIKEKLNNAEENNKKIYDLEYRLKKWDEEINNLDSNINDIDSNILILTNKIKQLEEEKANKQETRDLYKNKLAELKNEFTNYAITDTKELLKQIDDFNNKNNKINELQTLKKIYDSQIQNRDKYFDMYKELDEKIKDIEKSQNNMLKDLNIWYKLRLEDWIMSVFIKDSWIPLDELNKALQLELWVDIALNWPNQIKIITIEDANSLDPKTLESIKKKVEDKWAQCFIETVYDTWYDKITIQEWEILPIK